MGNDALERFKNFIERLPEGSIAQEIQNELITLLMECWYLFRGSEEESMEAYKLERMEYPCWHSPYLFFYIERHGAMGMGSSRAEIQGWEVNLDSRIAEHWTEGYRQKYPRNPPLKVKPIADDLSRLIIASKKDERLHWSTNGRVKILSGKFLTPELQTPKQTIEGRRKRLNKALEERLSPYGWRRNRAWWEKTN